MSKKSAYEEKNDKERREASEEWGKSVREGKDPYKNASYWREVGKMEEEKELRELKHSRTHLQRAPGKIGGKQTIPKE